MPGWFGRREFKWCAAFSTKLGDVDVKQARSLCFVIASTIEGALDEFAF